MSPLSSEFASQFSPFSALLPSSSFLHFFLQFSRNRGKSLSSHPFYALFLSSFPLFFFPLFPLSLHSPISARFLPCFSNPYAHHFSLALYSVSTPFYSRIRPPTLLQVTVLFVTLCSFLVMSFVLFSSSSSLTAVLFLLPCRCPRFRLAHNHHHDLEPIITSVSKQI